MNFLSLYQVLQYSVCKYLLFVTKWLCVFLIWVRFLSHKIKEICWMNAFSSSYGLKLLWFSFMVYRYMICTSFNQDFFYKCALSLAFFKTIDYIVPNLWFVNLRRMVFWVIKVVHPWKIFLSSNLRIYSTLTIFPTDEIHENSYNPSSVQFGMAWVNCFFEFLLCQHEVSNSIYCLFTP